MCGICGIYGIEDKTLIQRMLSVLRHRGPDDKGVYSDSSISLGHARLSIIDLSEKGRQPMSNEDGDIWLIVNGEIYNFMELRPGLEKKGHRFYSNSDSEIIIHAYEEYGLDFLDKLRGMFALALYDKKKKRLVLARDPIGKKPLYYYFDGKVLVFASEIKAIFKAGIEKQIDDVSLYAYLSYQHSLGERTLFKGIKKVLAGNMLILEQNKLSIQKYWDIVENITQASDDYFIKKLRMLLEESTRLRMIADVPVGAFLSGGIDSASIVALARPHAKDIFHTFSIGFETFSELEYAKIVSQHLRTTHHEITITPDMVRQDLPKIAWYYDEPLGDAAIINNYYLSREARKYVKVVLAGEGGDELFGGYQEYKYGLKYLNFFKMPHFARSAVKHIVDLIPGRGNIYSNGNRINRLAGLFCQPSFENAHLFTRREMTDTEIQYLSCLDSGDIDSLFIPTNKMTDPLNKMLALDCKNLLPEKFLMKADKGTMANSIEERLPLLDKEIIEFAFSVPSKLKIRNGQEKYILRKAVEDLLPPEIVNRKKQGFATPVDAWISSMKDWVYQTIDQGELIKKYFKRDKVQTLLDNFDKRPNYRARTIWTIFALELWYETYFKT